MISSAKLKKKNSESFWLFHSGAKTPKVFGQSSKIDFQKTPKVFAEFRKFLRNSESFIVESFWTSLYKIFPNLFRVHLTKSIRITTRSWHLRKCLPLLVKIGQAWKTSLLKWTWITLGPSTLSSFSTESFRPVESPTLWKVGTWIFRPIIRSV